eukprot:gene32288-37162_t
MTALPSSRAAWEAAASQIRPEGRAFINGAYVTAKSGKTFAKISPIDGRVIAEVAECDASDIDAAVWSAREAFEDGRWRDLAPVDKKRILLNFAKLIRDDVAHLALLETLDVGKVIGNSLAVDVPFCADCIQYYAEFADKLYDEVAPTGPNDLAIVRREPL